MPKKLLPRLITDLENEMIRLGYAEGSIKSYRRRWKMLIQFAKERGEKYFSERLGLDFLEKHFQILEKDFNVILSQSKTQEIRIIRTIGDFQLHRSILRRCCKYKALLTEPYFILISSKFKSYCENKEYSKITVDHYVNQSERFMDYLVSQCIKNCKEINLDLIHSYIRTLSGYTYKTVEQNICSMRAFFRFLLETKKITIDFAAKTPMVQARKQTRIPSVWTEEELTKPGFNQ
jgi:hypothetical protein